MKQIQRIIINKRPHAATNALALKAELEENLKAKQIGVPDIFNLYDIQGMNDEQIKILANILAEPMVDIIAFGELKEDKKKKYIYKQALPGQFDQRADSAGKAALLSIGIEVKVRNTVVYGFSGISDACLDLFRKYLINPVESKELQGRDRLMPETLEDEYASMNKVEMIDRFNDLSETDLIALRISERLSMSFDDMLHIQKYFRQEGRNPNLCELRVLDTYWSDHCRHTTFGTHLVNIRIDDPEIKKAFNNYLSDRSDVYGKAAETRPVTFMDIATMNMKRQKKLGNLPAFIDDKIENNACTIAADVNGECYQILFKNETHNHPTEIEPFGGASTCIGGAIRDPLSGRAYVYQAMRITGAGDITLPFDKTLPGKLPQFQITRGAAGGFSSYGNQIGVATGYVKEYYHPGYVAKRMEVGFVVGAVAESQVIKSNPAPGDVILLIGGRTGRDGIGAASGSSKSHDNKSLEMCGAEVQKGNAPVERSLQRLFRNPSFSKLVKKCNDFGAGGICVAVGEIADSIEIYLDRVPLKYKGLSVTEIAMSESQERMAVVISPEDLDKALTLADSENLEAVHIATVTDSGRVIMYMKEQMVLNISRDFLNAAGAVRIQEVYVKPRQYAKPSQPAFKSFHEAVATTLSDFNVASQKGLVEMFDSTVGARTVLHPFGGKTQHTPIQGSAMLIPQEGNYSVVTLATAGFDPFVSDESPYLGSRIAVLDSLAKLVAMGGDYKHAYLSFQEYMPRQDSPEKFGDTLAALLGAHEILRDFKLASIGGKDSMSGTFNDIHVPPTLISFALSVEQAQNLISPEFKRAGSAVAVLRVKDLTAAQIKKKYDYLIELIRKKKVISAFAVSAGGLLEAVAKMSFGNEIGFRFAGGIDRESISQKCYGDIVVEFAESVKVDTEIFDPIGNTIQEKALIFEAESVSLDFALNVYQSTFEPIFKTNTNETQDCFEAVSEPKMHSIIAGHGKRHAKVVVPVFFGTNSEDEMIRAFRDAGADVHEVIIRERTLEHVRESVSMLASAIKKADILALPGGFSGGDEPDGSAKLIVSLFRNPAVADAVNDLLQNRKGLAIGICNGFQALIKLGLFRNGEIESVDESFPTLGQNSIARHVSEYSSVKVVSTNSPWLSRLHIGEIYKVPISHGEGKLLISKKELETYLKNGQVFSQFADSNNRVTMQRPFNPNGSTMAIEGLISPCGRCLGKMGHAERVPEKGKEIIGKNIPGNKFMDIIKAGVEYIENLENE